MGYKALRLSLSLVCLGASMMAARAGAEEGLIAGITAGVAAPVDRFESRAKPGGAVSPFVGYMFLPYIGAVGEAQFVAFPGRFNANRDTADIWAVGGLAGPRLALPLRLGDVDVELNGTWEGGVFTGLNGDTPISRTSWGYSTGGGFDVRLSDDFLLGLFARYNWLDQRSEPGEDVQYITGGLALTYNAAPPRPRPEPAPPVVEPMAEAAPPPIVHAKKIVLRGVQFDFGSARIRADARPVLDEAAATLVREGEINIIAEGHTDDVGSAANNLRLSQQRAKAVREYLVTAGVAASRIRVEAYGESRPVASNTTDEGRAQNRRVELRIE